MTRRAFAPVETIQEFKAIYDARGGPVDCRVTGKAANGYLRIVVRKVYEPGRPWEAVYDHLMYVSPKSVYQKVWLNGKFVKVLVE